MDCGGMEMTERSEGERMTGTEYMNRPKGREITCNVSINHDVMFVLIKDGTKKEEHINEIQREN